MNSGNHEKAERRVEVAVHAVHRRQHVFLENIEGFNQIKLDQTRLIQIKLD